MVPHFDSPTRSEFICPSLVRISFSQIIISFGGVKLSSTTFEKHLSVEKLSEVKLWSNLSPCRTTVTISLSQQGAHIEQMYQVIRISGRVRNNSPNFGQKQDIYQYVKPKMPPYDSPISRSEEWLIMNTGWKKSQRVPNRASCSKVPFLIALGA